MSVVLGITNLTGGFLVLGINCLVLGFIKPSVSFEKPSSVFLIQMNIAAGCVGMTQVIRGTFILTEMDNLMTCAFLMALITATVAIYNTHMFFIHLDLFISIKRTAPRSLLKKTHVITMSVLTDIVWILLCLIHPTLSAHNYGVVKEDVHLNINTQCTTQIFSSYIAIVAIMLLTVLASSIIVNLLTICLIKKQRRQTQPSGPQNQNIVGQGMNARRLQTQTATHRKMLAILIIFTLSWFTTLTIRIWLQDHKIHSSILEIIVNMFLMIPFVTNGVVSILKYDKICACLKNICCVQNNNVIIVAPINVINVVPINPN